MDLERFYRGYRELDLRADELITAVLIPPLPPGGTERFRKVGTRRAQAISKVVGACRLVLSAEGAFAAAGLAFGSVGPTVVRCAELERLLIGERPGPELAAEGERVVRAALRPIDDLRSSAAYRTHVAGRLIYRWILEARSPRAVT